MWIDLLIEMFGRDWSRRWVRVRGLALCVLAVVAPGVLMKGIVWYADRTSDQVIGWFQEWSASLPGRVPSTPDGTSNGEPLR